MSSIERPDDTLSGALSTMLASTPRRANSSFSSISSHALSPLLPAQHDTVQLEPKIVVKMAGSVLLDHKGQGGGFAPRRFPARFGSRAEIALLLIDI